MQGRQRPCRVQAGPQVGSERKLVPIDIADEYGVPLPPFGPNWIAADENQYLRDVSRRPSIASHRALPDT